MIAVLLAAMALAGLGAVAGCSTPKAARTGATASNSGAKLPAVRTVKLPYRAYGMARVVGDGLYVSADSGLGVIDTLLRFDLRTGKSRTLFKTPADIAWVSANERWLLWESEKKLYAQPLGGGARRALATGREAYGPALEGDVAAWVDHEEGLGAGIVTFNLKTGVKREVARTHVAEFYNNFMQIRDGKLLWTDIYEGTGHYVVHDLATATTRDYPVPATARFRYPGYAFRSGDVVYSIDFDRFDEWDWGTQQLGRYSLATRSFTPITKGGYINALVVGRDAVAVIDSEQRLLVGPADGTYPRTDVSTALGARVDAVQVSSDGVTAVAGRSLPERSETTLFIFELK